MATITLSDILDDLRAADRALRKFEQRYWISSARFYELYSQGLLDNGEHREDFSEWAGYYKLKLKLKREAALEQLSQTSSTTANRAPGITFQARYSLLPTPYDVSRVPYGHGVSTVTSTSQGNHPCASKRSPPTPLLTPFRLT